MILIRLRFVTSQVRRKNKNAPNWGTQTLVRFTLSGEKKAPLGSSRLDDVQVW
jgi:hypothetical protein